MITFITDTDRHSVTYKTVNSIEGRQLILSSLENTEVISLDFETNGLCPYKNQLLLTALRIGKDYYVGDNTTVLLTMLICNSDILNKLILSHHAKFEYRFSKINGLTIPKLYCTMVAEQRLIMGTGFSASIVETCKRRKVPMPIGMDKDIRETFIEAKVDEIIFTDEQILYAASDVTPLEDIKKAQDVYINLYNMNHLIYNIEMPLISILGDSELDGFTHDSQSWIAYAQKKEKEAIEITKQLDIKAKEYEVKLEEINPEIIKRSQSRESKLKKLNERIEKIIDKSNDLINKGKTHLKAYWILRENYDKLSEERILLESSNSEEEYIGINWSSSDQVIKVFKAIKGFPIPMDKNKTTKEMQPSVGKDARATWFSLYSESGYYKFFKLFDSYKKLVHVVNAFGEKWVTNYLNPITNKVHTAYKQCNTDTGRLASGDAKNGWFNIQQIPAIAELRSSFLVDDIKKYDLITADLSGAELINMCSLADDKHLYELFVKYNDIHSSILTKAWRKIWKHRGDLELAEIFTVSKTENPEYRKKGKNGTFAGIYGCYPKKMATTIGVSVPEAELYLETLDEELVPTMSFVKNCSKQALTQGYLINNTRTNSRRWFTPVLMARGEKLEFKDSSEVTSSARNYPIQSTQADQLKEAMVVIDRFHKENNLDCKLKLQVHDELAYQFPKGLQVVCPYTQEQVDYPVYIKRAMINTANLFLKSDYSMGVDYHVTFHWQK